MVNHALALQNCVQLPYKRFTQPWSLGSLSTMWGMWKQQEGLRARTDSLKLFETENNVMSKTVFFFLANFWTFLNLSKCKALWHFLISFCWNRNARGLFGWQKAKFDSSNLTWDSRYVLTFALKIWKIHINRYFKRGGFVDKCRAVVTRASRNFRSPESEKRYKSL